LKMCYDNGILPILHVKNLKLSTKI